MNHPLQSEKKRRLYWNMYNKRFNSEENHFVSLIKRFFKGQQKRVLETFDIGKAFNKAFITKDIIDESFNLELEIKIAKESLLPYLESVLITAGKSTLDLAKYDFEFLLSSDILSTMDGRADLFARSINKTTFKQLKRQLAIGTELGETFKELERRIEDTYGKIAKGRALTIARTEIQVANQVGIHQAYKQAMIPIKIWVWASGAKGGVRDWHLAMDGEEQQIDTPFSNGLMFPGDPSGSAEEVINCQCTN